MFPMTYGEMEEVRVMAALVTTVKQMMEVQQVGIDLLQAA